MAVNKVEINGQPVIDLTQDTVTPESLKKGITAHSASGEKIVGIAGSTISILQDTITTSFFARDENSGEVTIDPGTPASNFCLYVQGKGLLTDPETGEAMSEETITGFSLYLLCNSKDSDQQFCKCTTEDLSTSDYYSYIRGFSEYPLSSSATGSGKYTLLNTVEFSKGFYFIWTVTEVLTSTLITW